MVSDLTEKWEALKLSDAETTTVFLDPGLTLPPRSTLYERFISKRSIGRRDLAGALHRVWKLANTLKISTVGRDFYTFAFGDALECNRVFRNQPWNFNGALLGLKRLNGDEKPESLWISSIPFWVQLHGLAFRHMTVGVGRELGKKIGQVLDVDQPRGEASWGKYLRVRVMLEVDNPLCRGMPVVIGDSRDIVLCRYEKLSDFCYVCGKLDHMEGDCSICLDAKDDGREVLRLFGNWLRADGHQISSKEIIETLFGKTKESCSEESPCVMEGGTERVDSGTRVAEGINVMQKEKGPMSNAAAGASIHSTVLGENVDNCNSVERAELQPLMPISHSPIQVNRRKGVETSKRGDDGGRTGGKIKRFRGRPKGSGKKHLDPACFAIVPAYSGGRKRALEDSVDEEGSSRKRATPMEMDNKITAAVTGEDQLRRSL